MEIIIIVLLVILCALAGAVFFVALKKKDGDGLSTELERRLTTLDSAFGKFDSLIRDEFARNREENARSSKESREELRNSLKTFEDGFTQNVTNLKSEIARSREESGKASRESREELTNSFKTLGGGLHQQFEAFSNRQENIRQIIDAQLKEIREETAKKLEEMRKTVDENLKDTVEKRFTDSFKLVGEWLEQVYKGLGEMQQIASGVGDLKRVLTNVSTRGTLGEIQLGSILEQVLSPSQFESQKTVKEGTQERVDYVIKLPDKNSMAENLLLPIDSKFPTEDYQRLLNAYDAGLADEKELKRVSAAFETSVRTCAKNIHDKYICPPRTTDFAIMFVPTEGLYAEIVRRADLFENLQRTYKITVVGPTNLAAFLSSLQMGFRTLAIEKRSNEVWELLGAVKTEFGKFGKVLDNIKKKINSAAEEIDSAGTRSRAIERKLRTVEELPLDQSVLLLGESIDLEDAENG